LAIQRPLNFIIITGLGWKVGGKSPIETGIPQREVLDAQIQRNETRIWIYSVRPTKDQKERLLEKLQKTKIMGNPFDEMAAIQPHIIVEGAWNIA